MNILKNSKRALAAVTIIFLLLCPAGWAKQKAKTGEKAKTDEAATHFAAGVKAADQRQYDQAIIEFTKAIEIDPKDIPAIENRAYMYLALQKNTEAAADFTRVIELAPGQTTSYLGRGQAETELKQFEPALTDLSKAIELKPDDPNAYRFRGFANIGKADWKAAIADYDKAIEMNPQDEQATFGALSPSEATTSMRTRWQTTARRSRSIPMITTRSISGATVIP